MNQTEYFKMAYAEARTRLELLLEGISVNDLTKRLKDSPNSVGFLMRHITDVELLFAKNVFKNDAVHVVAKTVIDQKDNGSWTNLTELLNDLRDSREILLNTIEMQDETMWNETLTTKEFGTKTKAEAFGRIISHTAYHAGQLALIKKYGNPNS